MAEEIEKVCAAYEVDFMNGADYAEAIAELGATGKVKMGAVRK